MRKVTIQIEDDEVPIDMAVKVVAKVLELGQVELNCKGYPKYRSTAIFKNGIRVVNASTNSVYTEQFKVDRYVLDKNKQSKSKV